MLILHFEEYNFKFKIYIYYNNIYISLTKEHELYRVFDSLTFEDNDTERIETGFKADGAMTEAQTKEFM